MKKRLLLFPILIASMSSCASTPIEGFFNYFKTSGIIRLYDGKENHIAELKQTFSILDRLCDNYESRGVGYNIYNINHTNEEVEIGPELYKVLETTFSLKDEFTYFNPLCGSLSKKWKAALEEDKVLTQEEINEELIKMNNTSLSFLGNNKVKRNGEGEIDLGAVTKGYALDLASTYLEDNSINQYLINLGSSSIVVGEKNNKDGYFTITLNNLFGASIKVKNTCISTSSVSQQGKVIEDVQYSHIINPITGSAVNLHDAVIVLSNNGLLGDILSTALMNNTVEEICDIEKDKSVECIVIKNNRVEYINENIILYYE